MAVYKEQIDHLTTQIIALVKQEEEPELPLEVDEGNTGEVHE